MIIKALSPGYLGIADLAQDMLADDPEWQFQLSVHDDSGIVIDMTSGDDYQDAIHLQASTTKGIAGLVIGLLVDRGELDVQRRVAAVWPEFAAQGKGDVTIAQLLSHQAGLVAFGEEFSIAEIGHGRAAAADLARQVPRWAPGRLHGYHSLTIGPLVDELVFRATGTQLWEFYDREIAQPYGIDYWVRMPKSQSHRLVEVKTAATSASNIPRGTLTDAANRELEKLGGNNRWINSSELREAGIASVSGTGSAAGLARAYAAALGLGGIQPLFRSTTVERVAQLQVSGTDLILGANTSFAILFQKPRVDKDFGTSGAFGHDGAGGALGFADPITKVAFGYTTGSVPGAGGVDPRAIRFAQAVRAARLARLSSAGKE